VKTITVDDLAGKIARRLERFAEPAREGNRDVVRRDFVILKKSLADLTPYAADGLRQSFDALIDRLERMRDEIRPPGATRNPIDTDCTHMDEVLEIGFTKSIPER
jgi:hypothetical protein